MGLQLDGVGGVTRYLPRGELESNFLPFMSDRQKLFYAILASAIFHLGLFAVLDLWPTKHAPEIVKPPPELAQLTVTILPAKPTPPPVAVRPAPTPKPVPVAVVKPKLPPSKPAVPVIDSTGLKLAAQAPAHPVFQADANTKAGSRLPATGNIPLPSMGGPKRDFMDFSDHQRSMGKGEAGAPMPEQTPSAITKVEEPAASPTPVSTPVPTPPPTPRPAPTPGPGPDMLAIGKATPTPKPTPIEQLAKLNTPPPLRGDAQMKTMPQKRAPQPPTQLETEKTHIDGGITAPGDAGVDAADTPYGRYYRKIKVIIGSRWQLYQSEHLLDVGRVTVVATINTEGKVVSTRVLDRQSSDDLAGMSTRAILESHLPPLPDDLAPMLKNGKLEVTFTFEIYDPDHDPSGR